MIADLLFERKSRSRRAPRRGFRIQPLEERRMLATVVSGQATNDDPDFLVAGDDLLTGEKIVSVGGLSYNSATLPHPIITLDAELEAGVSTGTLTSFDVELRLLYPGNSALDAVSTKSYSATGLSSQ